MSSLRQLSYDFFSLVTAAASGSHWGYKGLNGKVYIFISTSLTSNSNIDLSDFHTILTQKTVSKLGWNVHITHSLIYYI